MHQLLSVLWLPVAGATGAAVLLAVPGWWRERSDRVGRRRDLTDRLAKVYELELSAAGRRFAVPAGVRNAASGTGDGWDDLPEDLALSLSEAAEAFLAGTYRRFLEAQGRIVPAWAWVNGLAHGSIDDIVAIATAPTGWTGPDAVTAEVAVRVVGLVRRDGVPLEELQQKGLLPLEDRLAQVMPDPTSEDEVARVLEVVLRRWLELPPI